MLVPNLTYVVLPHDVVIVFYFIFCFTKMYSFSREEKGNVNNFAGFDWTSQSIPYTKRPAENSLKWHPTVVNDPGKRFLKAYRS